MDLENTYVLGWFMIVDMSNLPFQARVGPAGRFSEKWFSDIGYPLGIFSLICATW